MAVLGAMEIRTPADLHQSAAVVKTGGDPLLDKPSDDCYDDVVLEKPTRKTSLHYCLSCSTFEKQTSLLNILGPRNRNAGCLVQRRSTLLRTGQRSLLVDRASCVDESIHLRISASCLHYSHTLPAPSLTVL